MAATTDAYFDKVALLLKGEGADASVVFDDDSKYDKTVTPSGDAQIDTAQFKFGSASMLFDGTGDYLTVTPTSPLLELESMDTFTLEAWIRIDTSLVGHTIASTREPAGNGWVFNVTTSDELRFYHTGGSSVVSTGTFAINTWYHVAAVKDSGTVTLYIDGVADGTLAFSAGVTAGALTIGARETGTAGFFSGHIDELRLTPNIARYQNDFEVPTATFPAEPTFYIPSLLLHMDGADASTTFTDSSVNGVTVTAVADAQVDTADSMFGGASLLLDGTGDYLQVNPFTTIMAGSNTFTIEGWFKREGGVISDCLFAINDSAGGNRIVVKSQDLNVNGVVHVPSSELTTLNTWVHVTVVVEETRLRVYKDGVSVMDTDITTTLGVLATDDLSIGQEFDGASEGDYFNGYIDEFRITLDHGVYGADFTPPTGAFTVVRPDYESELLLHMDGTDTSTVFIDSSPYNHTPIALADAQIDTAESKFGGASGLFDGTGDYLIVPDDLSFEFESMSTFTIEAWIYLNTTGVQQTIFSTRDDSLTKPGWSFLVEASNQVRFSFTGLTNVLSPSTLSASTWYHLAFVMDSNTGTLYIDGVSDISGAFTSRTPSGSTPIIAGTQGGTSGFLNGNMDELRITSHVARYTTDFTPPTAAFDDQPALPDQAIIGEAFIGLVNNSLIDIPYLGFNIIGSAEIGLVNRSLTYQFTTLEKPEIVTAFYVCEVTGTADSLSDLVLPISHISQQLNTDGTSSVTVVCPAGLDYAEEVQARVNGGLIITTHELYSDGTTEASDSEEFTISSLQSSHGGRNFSVSVTGRRTLTFGNNVLHTLQGHSFTSTNAQGKRTVRCKLDKDIFPNDTVILSNGSEMVVNSVSIVISEDQKFMSLTE